MAVSGMRHDAGFSLAETLVATALFVSLTAALLALGESPTSVTHAQPAAVDEQQRARAVVDILVREIRSAGAGEAEGAGGLITRLAPIVPRRFGPHLDAADVVRSDALTVIAALQRPSGMTLAASFGPGDAALAVTAPAHCPWTRPVCAFNQRDHLLLFDGDGHFDVLTVDQVTSTGALVHPHAGGMSHRYAAGAPVVVAASQTFYVDAAARELRYSDGDALDVAIADDVVGLSFEYFGAPAPPAFPKPPAGSANCLYDSAGSAVSGLVWLAPDGGSLARLPVSMFQDGPWCGAGGRRFDADLLRIRRVRARVTTQAAAAELRASGRSFASPGTARRADAVVPDFDLVVDVTPRNLEGGR